MTEQAITLLAYCAGAGGLSLLMGKVSPHITGAKKHLLSGAAPLGAIIAGQALTNEVYTIISGTLAFGALIGAAGVAMSVAVTQFEKARLLARQSGG